MLYTYTIPVDDGAAPNPFYGMCTLAICKPGIRKTAKVGDWVAGLGSKNAPSGDLSQHLVYAMRIEQILTLKEYDQKARIHWPHRIPNVGSLALHERLGDCIYDYSGSKVQQRPGVHTADNMEHDLKGCNVLISKNFYYFGSSAIRLPDYLIGICHQTQGYRRQKNNEYLEKFDEWIRSLKLEPGQLYGWPDTVVQWDKARSCSTWRLRQEDAMYDTEC